MSTGTPCPACGAELWLVSTFNEWRLYCRPCDRQFNDALDAMPPLDRLYVWPFRGWRRIFV